MAREEKEIVASLNNLGDSGQDTFAEDKATQAKILLYANGISKTFLNSEDGAYIVAKVVEDLLDTGGITTFTDKYFLAPLRIAHPRSEDKENV